MSFLFSSKAPAKPTPGFHPIELPEDPKPREYAPDEVEAAIRLQAGIRMIRARRTAQGLRGAKIQHAAAASVQAFFRGGATRTAMSALKKEKLEQKATRHTAAQRIQEQFRNTHPPESSEAPPDEGDGALPPAEAFVIRNLDTGEAVSLELGKSDGDAGASALVPRRSCRSARCSRTRRRGRRSRATRRGCSRSSPRRRRSRSARTSCACGRSDTSTRRTTRSATSTSRPTCSRPARSSRFRTRRSSLSVRPAALR